MIPNKPLPFNGDFASPEEYVERLLEFVRTSETFQILCGGVHILDFFTIEPGLYHYAIPKEWQDFILSLELMQLLDLLMRDDLDELTFDDEKKPPESFITYIRTVRNLSLGRSFTPRKQKLPILPRTVAVGMNQKKIHEVTNFADYVDRLSDDICNEDGAGISHFVDFGSGQNYLGRALASEPYNRSVVAVEGRENNVTSARGLDMSSGLAVKPKVMRNKKLWTKILEKRGEEGQDDPEALAKAIQEVAGNDAFEFRPTWELEAEYIAEEGKGFVQYISGRLDSGDLADVVAQIGNGDSSKEEKKDLNLMAVSIHSCGNLSHFGIRSLVLNPDFKAVAIVGCCYNLLTERLGPPSYKHPFLRPTLQAVNGRVMKESEKYDPQGFPMSNKFSTYQEDGVRLNITARMMACQAPQNWSEKESDGFFSRHFFRAVLQKMFLDRGVVTKVRHSDDPNTPASDLSDTESPFDISTNPVIIGSLRKSCYGSLKAYVRGAVEKLTTNNDYKQYAKVIQEKMGSVTDEEIEEYEARYLPRKPELCAIWSLMAFSAMAIESLIVADRWTFLKEQEMVKHAWVETVFDYKLSPRNLVVVGIKK